MKWQQGVHCSLRECRWYRKVQVQLGGKVGLYSLLACLGGKVGLYSLPACLGGKVGLYSLPAYLIKIFPTGNDTLI